MGLGIELADARRPARLRMPGLDRQARACADAFGEGTGRVAAQVALRPPREPEAQPGIAYVHPGVVGAHGDLATLHLPSLVRGRDGIARVRLEGEVEHVHAAWPERRRHAAEVRLRLVVAVQQAE